jgi:hypothetical protein
MSRLKSAKTSSLATEPEPSIASPIVEEGRAKDLSALDGNERIAYLRESLEDARWLRHGRQATETGTDALRNLKRKWRRLYLPWAHSIKDGLWRRADGTTPLTDALKSETSRKVLKTAIALAIAVLVGWGRRSG